MSWFSTAVWISLIHLAANDFCDGGAVICVIDSRCFSCTQNGFLDAL